MRIRDWSSDGCSSDRQGFQPGPALDLDGATGAHGLRSVLLVSNRKVEDRHDGIADRLVEQSIVPPYRVRALVDEGVQHCRHRLGRKLVRQAGVVPDVRKQDGRIDTDLAGAHRSEEHTSKLQSLMRISYAVFCLKKKNRT